MDFSDLPASAQYRIAAAEIEADSIVANAEASAQEIAEKFHWGADPLGIDRLLYGDSIASGMARNELAGGRERAAGYLFGAAAKECLKTYTLDIERFNAKLEEIGDWVFQKYGTDRGVLDKLKQYCRALAFRTRAEQLETAANPSPEELEATPTQGDAPCITPSDSEGPGRKRGPNPDYETASRIAEVVARVVPRGDWKKMLDEICTELDKADIPYPKTWRKRELPLNSWEDGAILEPGLAKKAIEYWLGVAEQR